MSWNHRDRVFAMGVALQPTPGQFVLPDPVTGLIGVAQPNNGREAISAPDPTNTGTIWDAPRIFLGTSGTGGGTIPLRGYGTSTPPLANAFVMGIIMQACGFAEIRRQTATAATAVGAGSTTTSIVLDNSESSVDDMLLGMPIQNAAFGSGFRQTTLIADYVGATRTALLAETLGAAPTGTYIMPACLLYVLGTASVAPPLFSVSIWRDKVRYDYRDCVITSWGLDTPVSSENNTVFPSLDFAMKGVPMPRVDVASTPVLPASIRNVSVPPARGGKFFLDKIKLGHVGIKANIALTSGAPPNQNQDRGQDGYDIQSGSRTIDLTLNQMNVSDFDLDGRVDNQLRVSALSTWGGGTGNNFGLVIPEMVMDPQNPGSNNGYVTLAGNSFPTALDKSIALAIF